MEYYMKYVSEHKLIKFGFIKIGDGIYKYRFPAYKWNKTPTLWGEIIIDIETGKINTEVRMPGGEIYPPYYKCEYGNFETMLSIINANFNSKYKQFGIVEKKKNGKGGKHKRVSKM